MKINLNENLSTLPIKTFSIEESLEFFSNSTMQINSHSIIGNVSHKNYMGYLHVCYNFHVGYVLSPDIIWYTILSEIAILIKSDPSKFKTLFSTSEGKVDINIPECSEWDVHFVMP